MTSYTVALYDRMGVGSAPSTHATFRVTTTVSLKFGKPYGDANGYTTAHPASLSAGFRMSGAITLGWRPGGFLRERIGVAARQRPAVIYHRALNGGVVKLRDRLGIKQAIRLVEAMHLHPTATALVITTLYAKLGIHSALGVGARYKLARADKALIRDLAGHGVAAIISIGLQFHAALSSAARFKAQLAAGLRLTQSPPTPKLLVTMLAQDGVQITPTQLLHAIYHGTVVEGMNFAFGVMEPDGSITTWAINTRTGAVTEYTNFDFNSFARFGNHYLAASPSGLYMLDGDNDAGTPIISDILGGFLELTGTHFTQLKAAYIGLRARDGSEFILKLIRPDGREAAYRVVGRDMRTSRVDIGKGFRSRFFAYELISTGVDFDLTSIEFLPIQSVRRI